MMKRIFLFAAFFFLLAGGGLLGFGYYFDVIYPVRTSDKIDRTVEFEIKRGTGFTRILDLLYEKQLIDSKFLFYLYCARNGWLEKFKSGEYAFSPGISRKDLTFKLMNGSVKQYKITVVEGMTVKEIAKLLGEKTAFSPEKFLELCSKGELFTYRNRRNNMEGYLFPDTYFFDSATNEEKLIERMVENFSAKLKNLRKELNLKDIPSLDKVITMASIIEKESSNNEEKPLVASVFYNRLRKGYLLQTDPTVIYAINLEREFNGNITRKDLKIDSEYNTYRYRGLPPTPIANPGYESIKAALKPENSPYLYFVSMQNGRHHFSQSLEEHNRAVAKYQLKRQ